MLDSFTMETQAERSSGVVTATLVDETGAPVAKAGVTALTMTLYDAATNAIINSRKNQNVLDVNNVTMTAATGIVAWSVQPADMAMVSQLTRETHVAQFTAKWSGGAKEHTWKVLLPIENLPNYP